MGKQTGVFNSPQAPHMTIYDAAVKTNMILICTSRRVLSRSRKARVPLYSERSDNIWSTVSRAGRHIFRGAYKQVCPGW